MSTSTPDAADRRRRSFALVRKEARQIVRDPSSLIIAVILPLMLLFLFGYGVSFDARRIEIGLVVEDPTPETGSFTASLTSSPLFATRTARDRRSYESDLVAGRIDGIVVLAAGFSALAARGDRAPLQVIVDGSDPNKAILVRTYLQGVWANWVAQEAIARGERVSAPISLAARVCSIRRCPAITISFRDRSRSS